MTTDELIETLERRRTKSMAFEREFGLEGRTICPDDLDALFVTLSLSEASALISALKENQRLLAWEQAHADAMSALRLQLRGAEAESKRLREALEPFAAACAKADLHADEVKRAGMGTVSDSATPGWGIRYGHLKAARAALQPQGEK